MRRLLLPVLLAALAATGIATAEAAVLCDVSGSVKTAGGAAAPGVVVALKSSRGSASTKTSSTGSFATTMACGTSTASLGWSKAPASGLPASAGLSGTVTVADGGKLAFRLPAPVTATVLVTDGAGNPIPDALVFHSDEEERHPANDAMVLTGAAAFDVTVDLQNRFTDANGRVQYRTFPDADMRLIVRPPAGADLKDKLFTLNATTTVTKTVVLKRGVPLTVVVRDSEGAPVPGLTLGFSRADGSYETDLDGVATILGEPGTGTLGGSTPYDWADRERRLAMTTVAPKFRFYGLKATLEEGKPVEITLPKVSRIRLDISDGAGQPADGATFDGDVTVFPSDPLVVIPGSPGAVFDTVVETVQPYGSRGGVLEFLAFPATSIRGMRLGWFNQYGDFMEKSLPTIDARSDVQLSVQFPPVPPKRTITGTVSDADGQPVSGVWMSSQSRNANVAADGSFSISVSEGDTHLQLWRHYSRPGYRAMASLPDNFDLSVPVHISPETTRVDLRLPRAHHVALHVVDPVAKNPVKGAGLSYGDGSGDPAPISSVTVQGASGPASATEVFTASASDATGAMLLKSFSVAKAPPIFITGTYKGTELVAQVLDLEIVGDKRLELVLGTSTSPSTYRRPGSVSASVVQDGGATTARAVATTVHAVAATSSAVVRWNPPRSTGGLPVTGYEIVASPGGKKVRLGSTRRSATFNGLTPGTTYAFTVRALNAVGPARAATAKRDLLAPTAVLTAPTAASTRKSTVKAVWKGTDDASGVATYDLRVRSGRTGGGSLSSWRMLAGATTATSRTASLKAGHTYCFSVRARDKAGRLGAWSSKQCIARAK